ncbi:hypothetical protein Tco_0616570 [Tanacetum coccineum]
MSKYSTSCSQTSGLSLDHSFLGWIVMALIEPWIWVEHCGSSVGPSNTVSSFVGVILTLLLFKIGFKLGQSSVSQSLLHLRNLPLYTYRYNQLCSPAMALRGAEMMRYLRETHDPDYVPEPIHPEYILLEDDHEFPAEEQPLPPVDSPPGLKAEVDRLLARTTPSPSPHISLLPPSAEERLARVTKLADSMEHDTQTFMHTRDAQDNDSLWRLVMEWWTEEAYASQEAWAHSIRLSTSISTTNETRVSDCSMAELARHFEKTDHQTSGPDARQPGPEARILDHQDASGDADSHIYVLRQLFHGIIFQSYEEIYVQIMAPTTRRGPNTPVNNTNPNNMTPESIQAMIDQALLRNSTNGDGSHSSHEDNRKERSTAGR